ncbi:MAG: 3-deoxy-7-phosphoheptulonate synthase, partial [Ignavibacteria bacterium]|nr:3-deoxy-7-phosphoheptulonate synthase [Ignavibacteria bacterium]
YIIPMSLAAIAAGADGLMIEVHHQPELAYSDADQAIRLEQFDDLMNRLNNLAPVLGKNINIR